MTKTLQQKITDQESNSLEGQVLKTLKQMRNDNLKSPGADGWNVEFKFFWADLGGYITRYIWFLQ